MIALLLAASVAAGQFQEAFPGASTIAAGEGERLQSASGFAAKGLGATPGAAASAFLAKYGAAFGLAPPFAIVLRSEPEKGQSGPVRFERHIRGLPVFDGDIVVGVDAESAVILVNAADVPARVTGRARLSRRGAIRAARKAIDGLVTSDAPKAQRGYKAAGGVVRPVWRVEFVATQPPGDFRSDVDAHSGKVLSRVNLRVDANPGIAAPGDSGLAPKSN